MTTEDWPALDLRRKTGDVYPGDSPLPRESSPRSCGPIGGQP